jgi:hypothetical protein
VRPALQGAEPLEAGLQQYRRRHAKELREHAFLIHDYATGRKFNPTERLMFAAAARDPRSAALFDRLGMRRARPSQVLPRLVPRAIAVNTRHALAR